MSRCFPFPPPGYEKKIITDETDLLAKERHKEKKHKYDKKNKGKKEGKEKKDKDRSNGEHKEKKDKKVKHKVEENKVRDVAKNRVDDEAKTELQHVNGSGWNHVPNILQNKSNGDLKQIEELTRRIGDEEMQTVHKIIITDQTNVELPGRLAGSCGFHVSNGKENGEEKKEISGRINGQWKFILSRTANNSVAQKLSTVEQKTVNGFAKAAERNKAKKPRVRDQEEKRKSHSEDRHTEGKTKELNKTNHEQGQSKLIEARLCGESTHSSDARDDKRPDFLGVSQRILFDGRNLGKRKDLEINGFLNDNGNRPSKLQTVTFSHTAMEHGKKFEPQTLRSASEVNEATPDSHKFNKKQRINGFIKPQQPSPVAATQVNGNSGPPVKPSHPDSEYLKQILFIPEMDELPDLDDQEWLFEREHTQSETHEMVAGESVGRTGEVWDQALGIEWADISALPYVIPY